MIISNNRSNYYIYWFSYFNISLPSVRYRAKYFLHKLNHLYGVKYDLVVPGYKIQEIIMFLIVYISALFFRKKRSIIVVQKVNSFGVYARLLKLLIKFRKEYTIYDTDDADYTRFNPSNIHYFMKNCSICCVGSENLRQYTQKLNKNTFIITTPVFTGLFDPSFNRTPFTVGWIGFYRGHKESLKTLLFPAIKRIKFNLDFILMGVLPVDKHEILTYFSENTNINVIIPDSIDWYNEKEVYKMINTFSLGTSPLIDNEFNRSKSAFKLKQYQACGVPVLTSPVGENCYFLENGVSGFFCKDHFEFYEKINLVYKLSNDEYNKMCNCSFENSFKYSFEKVCSDYFNIINES